MGSWGMRVLVTLSPDSLDQPTGGHPQHVNNAWLAAATTGGTAGVKHSLYQVWLV